MNPTEHQIQQQIKNYLEAKGWFVMRLNSGKFVAGEGASKRFIYGQPKGTPDLMAFKPLKSFGYVTENGVGLIFIEVKRPGKKPTPAQEEMMKELTEKGARCYTASSYEELEKLL